MSGDITGGEKSDKITYEQYKRGIRDAKKSYTKLYKDKNSGKGGHVNVGMEDSGH